MKVRQTGNENTDIDHPSPASENGSVAATGQDRLARLERLAKLREDGALTAEEFETHKRDLLEK